jgi:aminomethyltransferase
MTDTVATDLRKTPLHARHRASNARMMPFAGWDMPVEYSGIVAEHMAVRTRAGLFDVSHMGQIEIAGKNALAAVQRVSSNDASTLLPGKAQYTGLLTPSGAYVDDMIVYRMAQNHFMLVVNASNVAKDYAWIVEQITPIGDVAAVDSSSRYALVAIQGPAAAEVLQPLSTVDLHELEPFSFAHGHVAEARVTVARTGYTGEDGFEIFVPPSQADMVWQGLIEAGRSVDLLPVGLGARDTLRLEAAMRLYGNDIDDTTTALEAGLGWTLGWDKDFIGRDALREQRAKGLTRKLVGFEMLDRGIARHGHQVVRGGTPVGIVTSGTQTPFLKKAIGMAYVPIDLAAAGSECEIDVRGRLLKARVVRMPFYKRTQ